MKLLPELLSYDQVQRAIKGTRHLLLGNGFSIACDGIYSYPNLYERARPGMSERVMQVFEYLGTNNFEGVMRLLHDGSWLAIRYGADAPSNEMREDLEQVKKSLVDAIAHTHLQRPNEVGDDRLSRCVQFLDPYQNVFTVCYDLLLYWVAMHGLDKLKAQDGFRDDPEDRDATYCVFREHVGGDKGIFFIHGALHIYVAEGQVRKHTWTKSNIPLIDGIQAAMNEGQFPLFVAEGDYRKKRDQILHNGYLDYCFGKLSRIKSPLVTFGFSFGDTDAHISKTIVECGDVAEIYVGLHQPQSEAGQATRAAANRLSDARQRFIKRGGSGKPLKVHFFDAATCAVWGQ